MKKKAQFHRFYTFGQLRQEQGGGGSSSRSGGGGSGSGSSGGSGGWEAVVTAATAAAATSETMARLVAVCRDGEEEFPFERRQIPLYIDDTLTMVMEFPDNVLNLDGHQNNGAQLKQFIQRHSMLKQQDLNIAMMVTSREVLSALSQLVPCVGCRRSVERLFSQLVESGNPALEPLTVGPKGVLSVTRSCMTDAKKLYTLFYVHGSKLNDMIDAIPKSKKNKRCQLHSLDTHKPKPLGEGSSNSVSSEKLSTDKKSSEDHRKDSKCRIIFHYGPFQGTARGCWMDVWELMSQECRDEVVLIDSSCLLETLETYLRKHRPAFRPAPTATIEGRNHCGEGAHLPHHYHQLLTNCHQQADRHRSALGVAAPPDHRSCFHSSPHSHHPGRQLLWRRGQSSSTSCQSTATQGRQASLAEAARHPEGETGGSMCQASQITLTTISPQTLMETAQDPEPKNLWNSNVSKTIHSHHLGKQPLWRCSLATAPADATATSFEDPKKESSCHQSPWHCQMVHHQKLIRYYDWK